MTSIHITAAAAEAGCASERSELITAAAGFGEKAVVRVIAGALYMGAKAGLNDRLIKCAKNSCINKYGYRKSPPDGWGFPFAKFKRNAIAISNLIR